MIKVYTASWCSSCKGLKKKLELMEVEVTYIDIDKEPDEARELGIRGIPFLLNTKTDSKLVGDVSVAQLKKFLA